MADIRKIVKEGVVFKKGKDESAPTAQKRRGVIKQRGKAISGAAKMKAEYKARKAEKNRRMFADKAVKLPEE